MDMGVVNKTTPTPRSELVRSRVVIPSGPAERYQRSEPGARGSALSGKDEVDQNGVAEPTSADCEVPTFSNPPG